LEKLLNPWPRKFKKLVFKQAIGTSGTLNNLAAMTNKMLKKQAIHPVLNFENLKSLYKEIILLNPEERSKMKGLDLSELI